ncbi:MAG: YerC/YecD family TrpR-related protein [bacterium]|nr:YerC/YecD family TrpR-related protein [bacterium]
MDRSIEKQFITRDAMQFYQAIYRLGDEIEVAMFLRDVMTLEELEEVIRRFKVAKMLSEGKTFRNIAKETGVSSATVARVNSWLNHGTGGYGIALKDVSIS